MRPRIMFVDDEVRILTALQRHLAATGVKWELHFESDPRVALETAIRERPDVVVCDMRMPVMDGISLLAAMRDGGVHASAIMLTGSNELAVATAAINEAGVFRFFTKPCPPEALVKGIKEALEHREQARAASSGEAEFKPFELVTAGVFVIDGEAHVDYANPAALEMMLTGNSVRTVGDGRLRLSGETGKPIDLEPLIRDLLESGGETQFGLARKEAIHPFSVTMRRFDDRDKIVVIMTDPQRVDPPSASVIGQVLRLTRSEAALVRQLALGLSVTEAAEACELSVQSARTYLKRIYQKTRTNRQSDLMRLVYSAFPSHLALRGPGGDA
ncbi:response regulator [Stappia sp. F7233]|uniref:Response regulator n=1 Tax=Stappia albiluteola TaxID=2758565 RepID=A0A839AF97_9HYPH|nr:response regulator [Stappia albiluteola]MBA5778301.1 response regulator [Stappia albiluteola]